MNNHLQFFNLFHPPYDRTPLFFHLSGPPGTQLPVYYAAPLGDDNQGYIIRYRLGEVHLAVPPPPRMPQQTIVVQSHVPTPAVNDLPDHFFVGGVPVGGGPVVDTIRAFLCLPIGNAQEPGTAYVLYVQDDIDYPTMQNPQDAIDALEENEGEEAAHDQQDNFHGMEVEMEDEVSSISHVPEGNDNEDEEEDSDKDNSVEDEEEDSDKDNSVEDEEEDSDQDNSVEDEEEDSDQDNSMGEEEEEEGFVGHVAEF
ncbi:hypothetical protein COLO4_27020 [Corchorus olitorius]|uniref:Uncharacterized protein n=1 Tax=Corchorus olitorius TaxID=93759 RepID=A0A1R3HT12_9ROSI|nr:hypothetical protein COLO4_27020 [Corchorus olitorius]